MLMNKKLLIAGLICFAFVLTLLLLAGPVNADSTTVTIVVKDSQGNPLQNVKILYKGGPISPGTWFTFGWTGDDGKVSKDLTSGYEYAFRAEYAYTMATTSQYVNDEPVTVEFQTSKITVELKTCTGIGLSGGKIMYRGSISPGTWFTFGWTGDDGKVSRELFPGKYWFQAQYKQTKAEKQQDVASNPVVTFTTTSVTLWFSGKIEYLGKISTGTWFTFTKPTMEMLPGTFTFRFAGKDRYKLSLDISGCSVEKSIIIAELLDHVGKGIEGGVAKYAPGGSWLYLGTTDSNGVICKAFDGKFGYVKVRMTYNQGSQQKTQYQPTNSIYTFRTVQAVIKLIDHAGNGLPGGAVWQGGGYWQFHGYTDSNGELKLEMFPGTYKFKMVYNYGSQIKWQDISSPVVFQTVAVKARLQDHLGNGIKGGLACYAQGRWISMGTTGSDGNTAAVELLPGTYKFRMSYMGKSVTYSGYSISLGGTNEHTVVFQTTTVTLWFSGNIRYASGRWYTFTKPTMELLPGTYRFYFDGYRLDLPISGDSVTKSIIIARLLDHAGKGIAGGVAKYAPGGTWYYLGTTDSNGIIIKALDGTFKNVKVHMTYNQGSQEKIQYQPTNSIYTFQTVQATIKLIDHAGNGIEGAEVWQGGGYWQFHGYTDSNGELKLEMFPGTYKFKMVYNHSSQTKWQDISTTVVFQTGMVHWTGERPKPVKASIGGTWVTFTQDMELLPGTYKFVFEDGSSQEVTVTAGEVANIP